MFKKDNPKMITISMCMKYLFPILLTCYVCFKASDWSYLIVGGMELLCIFGITNLCYKHSKFGYFLNCLLLFFYNVQMTVFIFGTSFITLMMLTNLDSIRALSGSAGLYISGAVGVLLFSLLPIRKFTWSSKKMLACFCGMVVIYGVALFGIGRNYSPFYGYYSLAAQYHATQQTAKSIEQAVSENKEELVLLKTEYYKEGVTGYREKEANLPEKPNVILIFTEGLSQSVVADERAITPNVAKWQSRSLNFINYYNHTFATYRGLNGQLYSGHQLGDIENNPLISLQSIFSDYGYDTTFINTEPENKDFTNYLENMGFDRVISDNDIAHEGLADSISDKDAYEILYNQAEEKAEADQPFFMSIYTFGTHASFNSVHEKFGDGKNPMLNKFADMDAQFGLFMDKFENNRSFDNTIIVFTADHATYQDDPFTGTFPDYDRKFQSFDEIPFFIYYKGITPETVDADGRNSLDIAPTLMDYLDMTAPNYFLGNSLFAEEEISELETCFYDTVTFYSSKDDEIIEFDEEKAKEVNSWVHRYFLTKALVQEENEKGEAAKEETVNE